MVHIDLAVSADANLALLCGRPNVTTVMVQPTPYDKSEAECLAFTDCFLTGVTCKRNCTYKGPSDCRCGACCARGDIRELRRVLRCVVLRLAGALTLSHHDAMGCGPGEHNHGHAPGRHRPLRKPHPTHARAGVRAFRGRIPRDSRELSRRLRRKRLPRLIPKRLPVAVDKQCNRCGPTGYYARISEFAPPLVGLVNETCRQAASHHDDWKTVDDKDEIEEPLLLLVDGPEK
jgi:hypothetical protein